jgi:hypothetical protein
MNQELSDIQIFHGHAARILVTGIIGPVALVGVGLTGVLPWVYAGRIAPAFEAAPSRRLDKHFPVSCCNLCPCLLKRTHVVCIDMERT